MFDETLEKYGLLDDEEEQEPRKKPRTRGLKRALAPERQREPELVDQLTLNEQLTIEINKNGEPCLDRENQHLEKLLANENRYNELLRRKVKHQAWKEKITLAKLKRANAKIEALSLQKEKDRLGILSEASLQA